MSQTAFVTSATGSQGGNVARQLLSHSWTVHATARDLSSPAAQSLSSLGVHLVQATWDDEEALASAMSTCTHLFLNLFPNFADPNAESTQASRILRLAKQAGVKHVIYTSGAAHRDVRKHMGRFYLPDSLMVKAVTSKERIETLVREGGFEAWTILRGANFMENFMAPKAAMYPGFLQMGVWRMAIPEDTKLPLTYTSDIARVAVAAFEDPVRFGGQEVTIIGDELTGVEIMQKLSAVTGRELRFEVISDEEVERERGRNPLVVAGWAFRVMINFMRVEDSKKWGVPLTTFDEFLANNEEGIKATYRQ